MDKQVDLFFRVPVAIFMTKLKKMAVNKFVLTLYWLVPICTSKSNCNFGLCGPEIGRVKIKVDKLSLTVKHVTVI